MKQVRVVWLRNNITNKLHCIIRDSEKHIAMMGELYASPDGTMNVYERMELMVNKEEDNKDTHFDEEFFEELEVWDLEDIEFDGDIIQLEE